MFRKILCLCLALCALGACLVGCKKEPVVNNDLFLAELSEEAVSVQYLNKSTNEAYEMAIRKYAEEHPEECGDPKEYVKQRLTLTDEERVGQAITLLQSLTLRYLGEWEEPKSESDEVLYGAKKNTHFIITKKDGSMIKIRSLGGEIVVDGRCYEIINNERFEREFLEIFGLEYHDETKSIIVHPLPEIK